MVSSSWFGSQSGQFWCGVRNTTYKQKTAVRDKDLKIALIPVLVYSLAFILSSQVLTFNPVLT